jgi:hypothetical protein
MFSLDILVDRAEVRFQLPSHSLAFDGLLFARTTALGTCMSAAM